MVRTRLSVATVSLRSSAIALLIGTCISSAYRGVGWLVIFKHEYFNGSQAFHCRIQPKVCSNILHFLSVVYTKISFINFQILWHRQVKVSKIIILLYCVFPTFRNFWVISLTIRGCSLTRIINPNCDFDIKLARKLTAEYWYSKQKFLSYINRYR